MKQSGKFLARVVGEAHGNVTLRKSQYRISDDDGKSTAIAKNIITGKIYNTRWVIERATRDYAMRLDVDKLKSVSKVLVNALKLVQQSENLELMKERQHHSILVCLMI